MKREISRRRGLPVQWLRELESTPYHIVAVLHVTPPPETVAQYFDEYIGKARRKHRVAALYSGMNALTINTDPWFCDAFGFAVDGGRDDYECLGDFNSATDTNLAIAGPEPLQAVFEREMLDKNSPEALVSLKFQKMLSEAIAHMTRLKVPLLASAHDYANYIQEIKAAALDQ